MMFGAKFVPEIIASNLNVGQFFQISLFVAEFDVA
jgi:hypothetical protein